MSSDCNWHIIYRDEELLSWRPKQTSFNYGKYGVVLQLTYEFIWKNFRHIRKLEQLYDLYLARDLIKNYAKLDISEQTYLEIVYDYDFCRDCFLMKLRALEPIEGFYSVAEGAEYPKVAILDRSS